MSRNLSVTVVGGGISGLSAAHRVRELAQRRGLPLDVQLLEAGPRLGGQILTERIDGLLLEAGPDSFVTHKPAALALCRRLGLENELLATESRRPQVIHRGRPVCLPEAFVMTVPTRLRPLTN